MSKGLTKLVLKRDAKNDYPGYDRYYVPDQSLKTRKTRIMFTSFKNLLSISVDGSSFTSIKDITISSLLHLHISRDYINIGAIQKVIDRNLNLRSFDCTLFSENETDEIDF